jgi:Uma2 family endonuclease
MTAATTITTIGQLLAAGDIGRCELVRGELITMTPAGDLHGRIGMRLAIKLGSYIEQHRLGECYLAETGFILARNPDTVRAPDFAFIPRDNFQSQPAIRRGFREGAPDLVVEVVSPDDSASYMLSKVMEWLGAGAVLVAVVDPPSKAITLYRQDRTAVVLGSQEQLRLEPVLPGFELAIRDVFEGA